MFKKLGAIIFTIIIASSCSSKSGGDEGGGAGGPSGSPGSPIPEGYGTLVVNNSGNLPTCDSAGEGKLYYIKDIAEFQYCDGSAYQAIDLRGPAGADGANGTDGINGTNGADGADGINGTNGADGKDGISIVWKGAHESHPTDPKINWAYYNSIEKISYLWDGNSWQIITKDGAPGGSISINGTIAPGSHLSLQHNLGRDDLSFVAQFIKDGYIYNWSDYQTFFSTELRDEPYYENANPNCRMLRLKNNNFIIAYALNSSQGIISIYKPDGSKITEKWNIFEPTITDGVLKAASLNNGNFVLVVGSTGQYDGGSNGYYYIFDNLGNIVKDKTLITPTEKNISQMSVATLNNGNFIITYRSSSDGNRGEFVIFNEAGTSLVKGPVVFDSASINYTGVTKLNNGNFIINYNNSFVIYDQSGDTIVRGPSAFSTSSSPSTVTVLKNNNFVIAYYYSTGMWYNHEFVIYNQAGDTLINGPVCFRENTPNYGIRNMITLSNSNFMIWLESEGKYWVYSEDGNTVVSSGSLSAYISGGSLKSSNLLQLSTGNVLHYSEYYTTSGGGHYVGSFSIRRLFGSPLLLQKVNNTEVRLINYTDESLSSVITVIK